MLKQVQNSYRISLLQSHYDNPDVILQYRASGDYISDDSNADDVMQSSTKLHNPIGYTCSLPKIIWHIQIPLYILLTLTLEVVPFDSVCMMFYYDLIDLSHGSQVQAPK